MDNGYETYNGGGTRKRSQRRRTLNRKRSQRRRSQRRRTQGKRSQRRRRPNRKRSQEGGKLLGRAHTVLKNRHLRRGNVHKRDERAYKEAIEQKNRCYQAINEFNDIKSNLDKIVDKGIKSFNYCRGGNIMKEDTLYDYKYGKRLNESIQIMKIIYNEIITHLKEKETKAETNIRNMKDSYSSSSESGSDSSSDSKQMPVVAGQSQPVLQATAIQPVQETAIPVVAAELSQPQEATPAGRVQTQPVKATALPVVAAQTKTGPSQAINLEVMREENTRLNNQLKGALEQLEVLKGQRSELQAP